MELSGFVALIYGLDIYRDGYEGIAWNPHEFKVIHVKKIRGNPNQSTTGMIPMGQRSVFTGRADAEAESPMLWPLVAKK